MAPDFNWTEKKGGNRGHINGKDIKPQPRPRQDTTSPHGDGKPNHNRGPRSSHRRPGSISEPGRPTQRRR